jgi:hypothetical protein
VRIFNAKRAVHIDLVHKLTWTCSEWTLIAHNATAERGGLALRELYGCHLKRCA